MNKIRRITALIMVVVMIGLLIGTLICAVTGSPYFFGMLALTFIVPIILWVFMWFTRLVNGESADTIVEEDEDVSEYKE